VLFLWSLIQGYSEIPFCFNIPTVLTFQEHISTVRNSVDSLETSPQDDDKASLVFTTKPSFLAVSRLESFKMSQFIHKMLLRVEIRGSVFLKSSAMDYLLFTPNLMGMNLKSGKIAWVEQYFSSIDCPSVNSP